MEDLRKYIRQTINESINLLGHDKALNAIIAHKDQFVSGETNQGKNAVHYSTAEFPYRTPLLEIGNYIHASLKIDNKNLDDAINDLIFKMFEEDYLENISQKNKYKGNISEKIKSQRNVLYEKGEKLIKKTSEYCAENRRDVDIFIGFRIITGLAMLGAEGRFQADIVDNLPTGKGIEMPIIDMKLKTAMSKRANATIVHEFIHFLQFIGSYWLLLGRIVVQRLNKIKKISISDSAANLLSADKKDAFYKQNLADYKKTIKKNDITLTYSNLFDIENKDFIFGGIKFKDMLSKQKKLQIKKVKPTTDYFLESHEVQAHIYHTAVEYVQDNLDTIEDRLENEDYNQTFITIATELVDSNKAPSGFKRFFDNMFSMFQKYDYNWTVKNYNKIASEFPDKNKFRNMLVKELSRAIKKEHLRQKMNKFKNLRLP